MANLKSKDFQRLPELFMSNTDRYLPFIQFVATIMDGESELTRAQKEEIALVVSGTNGCHYCTGAHSAILGNLGVDNERIESAAKGSAAGADEKMRAVLEFAKKLTVSPRDISQSDTNAVSAAGWSDQTIEDVICIVSLFSFFNRLTDGMGIKGSEETFAQAGEILSNGYGKVVDMLQQKPAA